MSSKHCMAVRYPQDDSSETLRGKIRRLQAVAWPGFEQEPWPDSRLHRTSLCLLEGEVLLAHAAIEGTELLHRGVPYRAAGLCEVVVSPAARGKGLGSNLLVWARRALAASGADLCVFTSAPELKGFYGAAGFSCRDAVCVVGGTLEKPFRSDGLGLVCWLDILSDKARRRERDFQNAEVFLPLGEGKLW